MSGAPVELDKRRGGVIASLRERSEIVGDQLETVLITPPRESIKAKALLLVGLGAEDSLSLKLMEAVGKVSLREAARLGVSHVAFAPLIRDQGNTKIGTGDLETAVVRGMLLAYDTEKRLQKAVPSRTADHVHWRQSGKAAALRASAYRISFQYIFVYQSVKIRIFLWTRACLSWTMFSYR